jgi:beta-glucanase (GH16 family)
MLLPSVLVPLVLDAPYRLVWNDEFDRSGPPNPANWGFQEGFVRNKEAQWYQAANARVEKGRLIIEAKRERVANPNFVEGSDDWRTARPNAEYTSACVTTKGKREFLYGRFEIRAKIDPRPGLWPAIWALGTTGAWPRNGEIDLLEFYQDTILSNTAWADGTWNTQRHPYGEFTAKDPQWADKFHVWRMDWDPDGIRITLDGQTVNETDLSKTANKDGTNPFHAKQYLLLNLAVGSTGGDPSGTEFPSRFEVDYVRVYQKSGGV